MPTRGERIPTKSRNSTSVPAEHPPHHRPEHQHGIRPIDRNYRLVLRTVLWVIAGLVLVGFAIWWSLT